MYIVKSASAQLNLLLSKIKETKIIVPPLNLQLKFVDFVRQVEKLKMEIQQELNKLDILYKILMQKYFKGGRYDK